MNRRRCRADAGFTLLEVMIAGLVLAIALLGLLSASLSIHTLDRTGRETELATRAASETLETVLATEHEFVVQNFGGWTFDVPGLSEAPGDADGRVGKVEVDRETAELFSIVVDVQWQGAGGRRAVRLASKLAPRE